MILNHQHFDLFEKVVLERMIFTPPLRAHSNMKDEACFLYAVNGRSQYYGPLESGNLGKDQAIVMKCGSYLNKWLISNAEDPFEAVAVHFYPEVIQLVFENKVPDFLQNNHPQSANSIEPVQVDTMIRNYIESLIFYFENPSLVNEELIILKVKELIFLLVNTDQSNRMRNILQDMFNPSDYTFKQIIKTHIFHDLSLEDLSILCNMSLSSFKRNFKRLFDESPGRYIRRKRLEHAADLLRISNKRITDICFDSGFNDVGYFSRSFTKEYGVPPSEYREA